MQIELPGKGDTVEVLDYYSQGAHEAYTEALSSEKEKLANKDVTDDDILNEFGIEFLQEMNSADEDVRQQMRKTAEFKIRSKLLSGAMSVKDMHRADRARVGAMIVSVNDAKENSIEEYLKNLPREDFRLLQEHVDRVSREDESEKKS